MKEFLKYLGFVVFVLLALMILGAARAEEKPAYHNPFDHAYAVPGPVKAIDMPSMNILIDHTNFAVGNPTFCSATLIDPTKGILLTANHCIRDQFEVIEREKIGDDGVVKKEKVRIAKPGLVSQLAFQDGDVVVRTDYTFKILVNDSDTDLALVQVKGTLPNKLKAEIACEAPVRGDTVYAVGNPYGVLYASLTKGIVSSTERGTRMLGIGQEKDTQFVQHSAVIVGGNSGGALYNESGDLVGVNVRGGATGIALATPLSDIKKIVRRQMGEVLWEGRCEKPKK